MRTTSVINILVALIGLTGAIFPFGRIRDIRVRTLGWNSSSPTIPREPPLPLPYLNLPDRRQDGDQRADLPTARAMGIPNHQPLGHGTQTEEDVNNDDPIPDDAPPTSTQPSQITTGIPKPTNGGVATAEERNTAMAGLAIALGAAVALLA
ncbi:hypothetical protein F5Y06DRAFT_132183 [Hypoxylon sp. FL0890]|nr:hypothetical protein F5Y06DRAFT_132183 [Hypoxylon sp. FL0890]